MNATVCPHCQRAVNLGSGTYCALTLCPHCGDTFYPPPPPVEPEPPVLEPADPSVPAPAGPHCAGCGRPVRGAGRRVLQTCRRCDADFCSESCLDRHHKLTGHGRRRSRGRSSARRPRPLFGPPDRCPECDSDRLPVRETRMSQTGLIVMIALLVMAFPLFWIGLLIRDEFYVCRDCGWRAPGPNNSGGDFGFTF
jgi:hypothetical protein